MTDCVGFDRGARVLSFGEKVNFSPDIMHGPAAS